MKSPKPKKKPQKPAPVPTKPRVRRTAEGARREILDAAEKRLADLGPDGLRLQQIAEDVGISHPAVLHHFGSREHLIEAVVRRAVESLEEEIIDAATRATAGEAPPVEAIIEQAYRVLVERGHGRVIAWLNLSGRDPAPPNRIRAVAEAVHPRRLEDPTQAGADLEDTVFRITLVALALLGEAVAGRPIRVSAGIAEDAATRKRFLGFLAKLVTAPSGERDC